MRRTTKRKSNLRRHRSRGTSLVEVAISTFTLSALVAIAVDLTIVTIAYTNLDSTARDCARAAGGQSDTASATKAAQSSLSVHATDGYFCQQPQLVGNAVITYQDWSQAPYNGTAPAIPGSSPATTECAYVTVQCSENVRLPIPAPFFGTDIKNFVPGSIMTFYRAYSYPIVKIKYTGS